MFPALRIRKAQRELNGGGFKERDVEASWPTRTFVDFLRSERSSRFAQLLSFHRPIYQCSGHRGPSRKQRFGNRRDAWRRHYRHG